MNSISPDSILSSLKWRYATKKFDTSKKISSFDWSALEQCLILTPSSFGLQPWKFVVVTSQSMKDQLKPACWGQNQVTDCSHFVVFMTVNEMNIEYADKHLKLTAETRGQSFESLKGFRDSIEAFIKSKKSEEIRKWVDLQAYIAFGGLMTAAAMMKIDACPMEGIVPAKVDEILKVEGFHSVVACALGYRASDDGYAKQNKVRFEASQVIQNF